LVHIVTPADFIAQPFRLLLERASIYGCKLAFERKTKGPTAHTTANPRSNAKQNAHCTHTRSMTKQNAHHTRSQASNFGQTKTPEGHYRPKDSHVRQSGVYFVLGVGVACAPYGVQFRLDKRSNAGQLAFERVTGSHQRVFFLNRRSVFRATMNVTRRW
jgi:hypothetical protein